MPCAGTRWPTWGGAGCIHGGKALGTRAMQSVEDTDARTILVSRLAAFERGGGTTTEILALFDSLPPVSTEALHGRWRGSGLPSGHPMDGLLERFGWYGKEFNGPEDVQPLLCKGRSGKIFGLNPAFVPMGLVSRHVGLFHNRFAEAAFALSVRAAETTRPTARLRVLDSARVAPRACRARAIAPPIPPDPAGVRGRRPVAPPRAPWDRPRRARRGTGGPRPGAPAPLRRPAKPP